MQPPATADTPAVDTVADAVAADAPDAGRRGLRAVDGPAFERPSRAALAAGDLAEGLRLWELWTTLGLQGVRRGYRRSVLGPLWLTLSLAVTVAVLSVLYGQLLGVALERYVPHLTLGFIAWQFIAGVVARSCNVFVRQKAWILNDRRPLSLFVLMDVWENVLEMAHNAPVYVGVALLYGIFAGAAGLQIVPGLALVLLNAVWVGLLLGTVCARFRDIAQIVASVMRIAFFVTPVIWMPEMLGSRAHLALYNPFAYFVEIIRAPLLGQAVPGLTWLLVLAVTAAGWTATCIVFTRYRGRVPYWL